MFFLSEAEFGAEFSNLFASLLIYTVFLSCGTTEANVEVTISLGTLGELLVTTYGYALPSVEWALKRLIIGHSISDICETVLAGRTF